MSVQKMASSMMNERNIPQTYWVEAIHTTVHNLNKSHLRPQSDKTPYELWFGRPSSIKHFKVFGSTCYIKNNDENIGKYDDRADEGIFLGYAIICSVPFSNRGFQPLTNQSVHGILHKTYRIV
jgi:hypothetical protein